MKTFFLALLFFALLEQVSLLAMPRCSEPLIEVAHRADAATKDFIEANGVLGSHWLDLPQTLRQRGLFFTLRLNRKIQGAYVLFHRHPSKHTPNSNLFYSTHLAIDSKLRGQGWAKILVSVAHNYAARDAARPTIVYSTVSPENLPSQAVFSSVGAEKMGRIAIQSFRHFSDQRNLRIHLLSQLPATTIDQYRVTLRNFWKDHFFADLHSLVNADQTYVILKNGQLVAGLTAQRRLFSDNAREDSYLALSDLYVEPGQDSELFALINEVLHRFSTYAAVSLDERSRLALLIANYSPLNGKIGGYHTDLMVWSRGIDDRTKEQIKSGPFLLTNRDF
jgi:RimJ/RimL family protein N-acetyltransferase